MSDVAVGSMTVGEDLRDLRVDGASPRDVEIERLHAQHYESLVRLAGLMLGSREVAEEVVQDAFASAYERWGRVREPERRVSYLRSAALNGARKRLRRRSLARRLSPLAGNHSVTPEDSALLSDRQHRVLAELGRLPARQQQCLILRFYEDLNGAEIAEWLGISRGSVKTHTHRGLRTLESRLEDER